MIYLKEVKYLLKKQQIFNFFYGAVALAGYYIKVKGDGIYRSALQVPTHTL